MTTTTNDPPAQDAPPRQKQASTRLGDAIFSTTAKAAGILILIVLAGVAAFLVVEALPTFQADASEIDGGQGFLSYVWPLVFGTLVAAIIALLIATPLALGIALFISHYAPRRMAQGLGYTVDLLAAVPSVVFGLWGIQFLAPTIQPVWAWLADKIGRAHV